MKNNNPFSLMFGKSPYSIIKRYGQFQEIFNAFNSEHPSTYTYLITGIRGSGKTVMLRQISEELSKSKDWIILDANSQNNMVKDLSEKFLYEGKKYNLFLDWSISINAKIFTLQIGKKESITNPEIIFERLLKKANEDNKKILITIDEVVSSIETKRFANFYQSMIGKNYNLFLLMTGLKNNINSLISSNASIFLSKTPKINLSPLSLIDIANEYQKLLDVPFSIAVSLSKLTNGYAFAYQVLGYLFFESEKKEINDELLNKYDSYLQNSGYDVIYKDLTEVEKQFCCALAESKNGETKEIMEISQFKENYFQKIRSNLIEKEILTSVGYGKLEFTLPRFSNYIKLINYFN